MIHSGVTLCVRWDVKIQELTLTNSCVSGFAVQEWYPNHSVHHLQCCSTQARRCVRAGQLPLPLSAQMEGASNVNTGFSCSLPFCVVQGFLALCLFCKYRVYLLYCFFCKCRGFVALLLFRKYRVFLHFAIFFSYKYRVFLLFAFSVNTGFSCSLPFL